LAREANPQISVCVWYNDNEVYFYVAWQDATENRTLSTSEFSDAVALMFPLVDDVPPSTLMMGFLGKQGVNIWHWKASQDLEFWSEPMATVAYADFYYPFENQETLLVSKSALTSAVSDLLALKVTTTTAKATQNVQGRGVWDNGTWHVVFKRALQATNAKEDVAFGHGARKLMAFAVWAGDKGDRGGRKSISDWVQLEFR
jgi:DMSO reductase family type II enzyme heme b subunit